MVGMQAPENTYLHDFIPTDHKTYRCTKWINWKSLIIVNNSSPYFWIVFINQLPQVNKNHNVEWISKLGGCRHSSVDSSAPTILTPWVQIPSTTSMVLSFIVVMIDLSCEKNKNKQKEAGLGPFLKKNFKPLKPFLFIKFISTIWKCLRICVLSVCSISFLALFPLTAYITYKTFPDIS